MPSYRVVPPPPEATIAELVTHSYRRLVRLWREQRDMEEHEVEAARALSAARAELGIPLADSLTAQRITGELVWRTFRKTAGRHPAVDRDFLLEATERSYRYLNTLEAGTMEAHLEVAQDQEQQRNELERSLIDTLLRDPADVEAGRRAARAAQVDLQQPWQVLVVHPMTDESGAPPVGLPRRLRAMLARPERTVVAAPDAETVRLLVGGIPVNSLDVDGDLAIGIGGVRTHIDELAASHAEAKQTVAVARRRGGGALHVDDVWFERFLAGRVQPDELVDHLLAPLEELEEGKREMAAESLHAYLDEECSVTAAARRLHLHPQSFRYRLGKLEAMFGGALEDPCQRLLLHVAITRYRER